MLQFHKNQPVILRIKLAGWFLYNICLHEVIFSNLGGG